MSPHRTRHTVIDVPPHDRHRYEPVVVRVEFSIECSVKDPALVLPSLDVRRFEPVRADHGVYAYGTNGSPRDRMRHQARLRGEPYRTQPYTRIA